MRMNFLGPVALAVVLFAAMATGCKKDPKDNTPVTFANRIDRPLTLDIYSSEEDYASNTNRIEQITIPANSSKTLPGSMFTSGRTYYMDWYSDDYYYNNWYNDDYPVIGPPRVRISPEPGDNTYYLDPGYKGQARNAFLEGAGTESTWISIGAFLYSATFGYTNESNTLTPNELYRRVTIRKNFNAEYTRKDTTGNMVTENITFMVQQSEVPYIEFKDASGVAAGNMTGGKLPTGTPPDYKSNSADTVMALFPDNEYMFMMVRQ